MISMRTLAIGEKFSTSSSLFVSVKSKGDSITFRIAQDPVYIGKHFISKENGWDVFDCPRINDPEGGNTCEYCEHYFDIMNTANQAKESDKDAYEDLKKEARKYQVAIQFYFPILNRDNGKFQVLKTTLGVKNKLDEFHASGINVFESDWILRNTGSKSPRDLYSLVRKDSSEVEPLSDVEKEEYEKALAFNLMSISENVVKHDPEVEEIEEVFSK